MIRLEDVTVSYADQPPVLTEVNLQIAEAELVLVAGSTGSGKSTLLTTLTNLVPQFSGGRRSGRILLDGRDVSMLAPRDLAGTIGLVLQDPQRSFVTDTVESELVFGMEQLGLAPSRMRVRLEETLDLLGIGSLRSRALRTLSGGEQQRVAIGAVLTAGPRLLVLDEPTSALDPVAAEDVMAVLARLVHDVGITVLAAEHRMERVIGFCDSVLLVDGGQVRFGPTRDVLADSPVVPPLVELGQGSHWHPLPLTIREGRRAAASERDTWIATPPRFPEPPAQQAGLTAAGVVVKYGKTVAVAGVDVDLPTGVITALMGRNGSGKSSLLWAIHGAGTRTAGTVRWRGEPIAAGQIALVPQTASDLLYLATVSQELQTSDAEAGLAPGTSGNILDDLAPNVDRSRNPRDLSEGQKLALVLAIQLARSPAVVLLDEPTRGLDYTAKRHLATMLRRLTDAGHAVMIATHDVEFVAQSCDRAVVLAGGEVVDEGSVRQVLAGSTLLAPQCAKVYAPVELLTPAEVVAARQDRS